MDTIAQSEQMLTAKPMEVLGNSIRNDVPSVIHLLFEVAPLVRLQPSATCQETCRPNFEIRRPSGSYFFWW